MLVRVPVCVSVSVYLFPGFFCSVQGQRGVDHWARGMCQEEGFREQPAAAFRETRSGNLLLSCVLFSGSAELIQRTWFPCRGVRQPGKWILERFLHHPREPFLQRPSLALHRVPWVGSAVSPQPCGVPWGAGRWWQSARWPGPRAKWGRCGRTW